MKKTNFYTLLGLVSTGLFFGACNSDDPTPIEEGGSKYVLITLAERNQDGPGYLSAFDEFPTGTISNVVGGKSLQGMSMTGWRTYDNWIFKMFRSEDRTQGIEKIQVAADGAVTAGQFLTSKNPTEAARYFGTGNFVIESPTSGFYWDAAEPTHIQRFNPTTMSNTGSLDFTAAVNERGVDEDGITFRAIGQKLLAIKNGKLFASLTYAKNPVNQIGFFDDFFPDIYIAVIDVASGNYEKTIRIEDAGSITYINENHMYDFDTNGDMYIDTQGKHPQGLGGTSKIARIKANETDIDNSWVLNFSDFRSADDGKFVNVFAKDGRLIVTLNTVTLTGGPSGNINSQDIWKFYSVDIATKQFTEIQGIPVGTNPGAALAVTEVDGKILLRGSTINYSENGYYEYNPATNTATKLFQVSEGGGVSGFTKINVDN